MKRLLNPKYWWLRATVARHNQGVDNGWRAAHRQVHRVLVDGRNKHISEGKSKTYIRAYDDAAKKVLELFDWALND